MTKFRSQLQKVLMLPLVFLAHSSIAKADVSYPFIKIMCDPMSHSTNINFFNKTGEAGSKLVSQHDSDVYYIEDVGGKFPDPGKTINCDLASDKQILLKIYKGDVPNKESVSIFGNGAAIGTYNLGYGDWTVSIKSISDQEYTVTYCGPALSQNNNWENKCVPAETEKWSSSN